MTNFKSDFVQIPRSLVFEAIRSKDTEKRLAMLVELALDSEWIEKTGTNGSIKRVQRRSRPIRERARLWGVSRTLATKFIRRFLEVSEALRVNHNMGQQVVEIARIRPEKKPAKSHNSLSASSCGTVSSGSRLPYPKGSGAADTRLRRATNRPPPLDRRDTAITADEIAAMQLKADLTHKIIEEKTPKPKFGRAKI